MLAKGFGIYNKSSPLRLIGAGGSLLLIAVLGATAIWQGITSL